MTLEYEGEVSVGCGNFSAVWGDKSSNLGKLITMTVRAAEMGVNIIAFPELALTGYECETENGCAQDEMHQRLAETVPGPSTVEIARLAKEYDIYVIFGLPERDQTRPDRVYNAAALVGPAGIIGSYRKLHLPGASGWTESLCFTKGAEGMDEIPVFDTRYGPVGISICYDFWRFPEITRIQTMKGARILFNLTANAATPGSELEPEEHLVMSLVTGARAAENGVYVASANLCGTGKYRFFYGHSLIAGPAFPRFVRIYAEGGAGEEIVAAELSMKQLLKARETPPFLQDREAYSAALILEEFKKLGSP